MTKLTPLAPDEYDAIAPSGGRGRAAKPGQYLAEIKEAAKLIPSEGWGERDGFFLVKCSTPELTNAAARELRRSLKQVNAERGETEQLTMSVRPRTDHPKLGHFVAWRVERAVVADSQGETAA